MKVFIYCTEKKTKEGRKFRSYWAYMYLKVKGEEEKGKQRKSVNVSFHQGVDNSKITRGVLEGDFDLPERYEVKKDKDGKDKYPAIWVNSVKSFTEVPRKRNQNAADLIAEEITDGESGESESEETPF